MAQEAVGESDPLRYEIAYLQAEMYFQQKNYKTAIEYYTQALPEKNREKASWYPDTLKKLVSASAGSKYRIENSYLLGMLAYKQNDFASALPFFEEAAEKSGGNEYSPQCKLWAIKCHEKLNKSPAEIKKLKQELIDSYPLTAEAAEAGFSLYTFKEYLQGDKAALKHLENFVKTAVKTPLILKGQYLLFLDHKRDRKNSEGRWLRHKNLMASIDILQELENNFSELLASGVINKENEEEYIHLYQRARLDRAIANLEVALESEGGKKEIYLEYAKSLLQGSLASFLAEKSKLSLAAESCYFLAKIEREKENLMEAEASLERARDLFGDEAGTANRKLLSRIFDELAAIALQKKEYEKALSLLAKAEEAGKGGVITSEEKLTLWINRSSCYKNLSQNELAMLWLSRVVNDETVSSLRLKAMYLRAELYELMGRDDQAQKQLIALAKLSGEWAGAAKEKLERDYVN